MNKINKQKETDAIDALIQNSGDEVVYCEDFMTLLGIDQEQAERSMTQLQAEGKLAVKWLAGPYYKNES